MCKFGLQTRKTIYTLAGGTALPRDQYFRGFLLVGIDPYLTFGFLVRHIDQLSCLACTPVRAGFFIIFDLTPVVEIGDHATSSEPLLIIRPPFLRGLLYCGNICVNYHQRFINVYELN